MPPGGSKPCMPGSAHERPYVAAMSKALRSANDYLPTSFWLMKTEPDVFSFEDLCVRGHEAWDGVRNYQARNFMRDHMALGHRILFYHSRVAEPAIVGLAEIVGPAVPDPSALDPKSPYYDARQASGHLAPWVMVTLGNPKPLRRHVTLTQLKQDPQTQEMLVVRPGQRLSVQPVSADEFAQVLRLAGMTP